MRHHYTTDPVKRAEHIANREERLYMLQCIEDDRIQEEDVLQNTDYYDSRYMWRHGLIVPVPNRIEHSCFWNDYIGGWPRRWIETYKQALGELIEESN